ncbi:MAG TPA: beta-N-acetylglucosaminidase domain-containing protein [Burkholderiales bacterium]|nr:beta-N-acetylglucosaminidase domain-containing protein [Burkholderiales bacterium]
MDRSRSTLPTLALAAALLAFLPTVRASGVAPGDQSGAPCRVKVVLPESAREFPEPLPKSRKEPGFALRGTKGWGWTADQYLAEIPFLAKVRLNFLMNCYLSMFTDPDKLVNRWWEPIPPVKKRAFEKVVRSCREHGISFCFAIHPQLFSDRPLRYGSEEDFRNLWQHFAWMQGLGVRWFSLSYDDISVEGQDRAKLAESQARLVNRILAKLRAKDPKVRLIFCPVYYWGDGSGGDAQAYLGVLARVLDPDVFVFWTGDGVVTRTITVRAAEAYRAAVKHRLVIWDNYPVNDRSGALHLGPVTGREPGLAKVAYGYMSNPLSPQNEVNRVPLSTCADFAWNPWAYDPARSIGQAIVHLAASGGQQKALKDLVELYPGDLACGVPRTDYDCVVEEFNRILAAGPAAKAGGAEFLAHVEAVAESLDREFPARFADARKTLGDDIARLRARLAGLPK